MSEAAFLRWLRALSVTESGMVLLCSAKILRELQQYVVTHEILRRRGGAEEYWGHSETHFRVNARTWLLTLSA